MKIPIEEISLALKTYSAAQRVLLALEAEFSSLEADLRKRFESKTARPMLARAQAAERLQSLAFYYYDYLFAKKKLLDTRYGRIGFRVGKPKVIKARGVSWDSAVAALANKSPHLLRTKSELDKARMIALRADADTRSVLADVGLSVVQDEYFYIQEK